MLNKIKNFINNLISKIGDKNVHLICGFLITLILGLIFNVIVGIVAGCVAGLAKETLDELRKNGTGFDKKDLYYTLAGVIIAAIIVILL